MKLINKLLGLSLLVLPFSCFEPMDEELSDRLTCGSDSFESIIDGSKFTDGNSSEPASVLVTDSVVVFSLYGEVQSGGEWHNKWDRRTLSFTFPLDSLKLNQFSDLVALDSMKLKLGAKDSICMVEWKRDYRVDTLSIQGGELSFTKAKLIGIDGDRNSVFLSGTFDFKYNCDDYYTIDSTTTAHSRRDQNIANAEGWFDVVITGRNFSKK